MFSDVLKKVWLIIAETFSSFRRNNDLSAASSLAFSATLALFPALFLLTFLLGAVIGLSGRALAKTQELLTQLIPAYSQDILSEVRFLTSHMGTIGAVNILVLLWSVTPLAADLRVSLGTIFHRKPDHPFLLEKLFDVAISIIFLIGLSAIAVAGVLFTLAEKRSHLHLTLGYLEGVIPFLFVMGVGFSVYVAFSTRVRLIHLAIGAFVAAVLWFAMRPAFQLFLAYNPGYGFAFGSFKSLFVLIIWIYCSLVAFLFGAEIAANLGRDETVFIKKLMQGGKNVPAGVINRYVISRQKGTVIFSEGDPGNEMFSVRKGTVAIRKGEREIGVITAGTCFGGMSFLLSSPRVATAVALEDVELVSIDNENINKLMNEYPEFVVGILREMAQRLRETNKLLD
jgi:membrane protein